MKKDTGEMHSVEQFPILLVNDEKLKDPTDMANSCNNFFLTITEKCNIQQIQKEDAISILKDLLLGNFHKIKIIPITDAEIQSTIYSLKPKKSSGYDEIRSKILKIYTYFS